MKIDASAPLVVEKDNGGARGSRDEARTGQAASAFGEAVRKAGETHAPQRRATANATATDEAANGDELNDTADEQGADDKGNLRTDDLRNLLFLVSAASADNASGEEGDVAEDAAQGAHGAAHSAEPAAETGGASADRRSQVRVLRAETHFEPRLDGQLNEEAVQVTAPTGEVPAQSARVQSARADAASGIAQNLQRIAAAQTAASPDASAASSKAAGVEVSGREATSAVAEAAGSHDPAPMPVRFGEAVARLGQPLGASGAGGNGGSSSGRESERRGGDRADASVATATRSPARGDLAAASLADSSGADASPSPLPGLAAQVATRIADALQTMPADQSGQGSTFAAPGSEAHLRLRAGGAALKTLTLQLQPEHLGTLEVSMRLREGKLAIELTASKPEAAAALTQDRETLRKVLEGAGFSLDEAAVTVTVRDNTTARVADTSSAASSNGGEGRSAWSAGSGQQNGNASDREGGRRQAPAQPAETQRRATSDAGSPRSTGGQTYL